MSQIELNPEAPIYGGMCLSRHEGIVFVKGAIPGETVLAAVKEKKKDYSIAEAVEIIDSSGDRVQPRCPVFGLCGGCNYQHISYQRQLTIKEEILSDCLKRIGNIDFPLSETLKGQPWHYRSKAQFKVSRDGKIGFYRENSREVIVSDECFLIQPILNRFLKEIKKFELPESIKEIHLINGKNTVAFIKGNNPDESMLKSFMDTGLDGVVFEDGRHKGDAYCFFSLGDLIYTVSPQGFFQTNWPVNLMLIQKLIEVLGDIKGKTILDVYGGAGNLSLPLSGEAKKITVVEENPFSVLDGERNLQMNEIKNGNFITKPFERIREGSHYDIVILDPPRRGLSSNAMEKLLRIDPQTIAYVSCNPSTFARDIAKLTDRYTLASVRLIDMFPNTYHCEVLGILEKK